MFADDFLLLCLLFLTDLCGSSGVQLIEIKLSLCWLEVFMSWCQIDTKFSGFAFGEVGVAISAKTEL